ncbi:hypothetical protein NL676_018413 [Syzygium grande]|nr:hypothetical protein NL676_018413 [Syzygium grande]
MSLRFTRQFSARRHAGAVGVVRSLPVESWSLCVVMHCPRGGRPASKVMVLAIYHLYLGSSPGRDARNLALLERPRLWQPPQLPAPIQFGKSSGAADTFIP